MGESAPAELACLGQVVLLQQPLLGVFASARCPATLILKAHDWAQSVKDSSLAVVSGFHSPAEQEILAVLLRGTSPIVIVAARDLEGMRIPAAWRSPIEQHRLLLLSPFPAKIKRSTAGLAEERNRLALALATQVLVIHATPGGKTESAIVAACLAQGKPVTALPDPHNQHLFAQGIQDFSDFRSL